MTARGLLPLLLASSLLLAGCASGVDWRIEQRQAEFSALDPVSQANIKNGQVNIGYTPDMVYMALGEPVRREQHLLHKGVQMIWVYKEYYSDEVGAAAMGHRRQIIYNPRSGTYAILVVPVPVDIYAAHAQDHMRVEFLNGKVSAVEQDKNV